MKEERESRTKGGCSLKMERATQKRGCGSFWVKGEAHDGVLVLKPLMFSYSSSECRASLYLRMASGILSSGNCWAASELPASTAVS